MRLTCPNCGARYEVDDSMIPAEGRDVQCSNCTTTWFQPGVAAPADTATVCIHGSRSVYCAEYSGWKNKLAGGVRIASYRFVSCEGPVVSRKDAGVAGRVLPE